MKHNGGQHNDARKPDEILAEIERTRHDMDSTLTAIEHRLTPGQLFDQGVDYLRNSGGHESSRTSAPRRRTTRCRSPWWASGSPG
jgi:hypothetical protein